MPNARRLPPGADTRGRAVGRLSGARAPSRGRLPGSRPRQAQRRVALGRGAVVCAFGPRPWQLLGHGPGRARLAHAAGYLADPGARTRRADHRRFRAAAHHPRRGGRLVHALSRRGLDDDVGGDLRTGGHRRVAAAGPRCGVGRGAGPPAGGRPRAPRMDGLTGQRRGRRGRRGRFPSAGRLAGRSIPPPRCAP